jgi:hypothetical protein
MRRTSYVVTLVGLSLAAGTATVAAPQTDRPGMIIPARVWVENRRPDEALPVAIVRVDTAAPQPVTIVGATTFTLPATTVLQTREARQAWEYRALLITAGQDPAALLNTAGQDGWETTGYQFPSQAGLSILLKRPR